MYHSKIDDILNIRDELCRLEGYMQTVTDNSGCIFKTRLVASELITNVLMHSKCVARIELEYADNSFVISVESEKPFEIVRQDKFISAFDENGRGLMIIDALCEKVDRSDRMTRAVIKIDCV